VKKLRANKCCMGNNAELFVCPGAQLASSVTGSLKNIENVMKQRHNTATMAVLSLHIDESLENGADDDAFETNIDTVLEDDKESSIDAVLGMQENTNRSSEEASSQSTDSNSRVASPLSDDTASPMPTASEVGSNSTQLESHEVIRKSESDDGEVTVTSVTVSCTSLDGYAKVTENGDDDLEKESNRKDKGAESSSQSEGEDEEKKMRTTTSTQVLIRDEMPTISVNLSNYDSDDTLSDEESVQNLDAIVDSNEEKPPVQNGGEANSAPATTGESTISKITVKEDRTGSNASADETSTLKTPEVTRRRCEL